MSATALDRTLRSPRLADCEREAQSHVDAIVSACNSASVGFIRALERLAAIKSSVKPKTFTHSSARKLLMRSGRYVARRRRTPKQKAELSPQTFSDLRQALQHKGNTELRRQEEAVVGGLGA